jgi:hypothetical protein
LRSKTKYAFVLHISIVFYIKMWCLILGCCASICISFTTIILAKTLGFWLLFIFKWK